MVVPRGDLRDAFVRDYAQMRSMFFAEPPPIDDLLARLAELERRIRAGGESRPNPTVNSAPTF